MYEDEYGVAFNDINPKAPVHILVVPKKHITSLAHSTSEDDTLLGHLLAIVRQLAESNGLDGYKTLINTGREGGQVVDHLHVHLIGGKKQTEA